MTTSTAPAASIVVEPMHDYLAREAISAGNLHLAVDRSLRHLKFEMGAPDRQTPSKKLGTAAHVAILEPDQFNELYVTAGQCAAMTKPKKKDAKPKQCSKTGSYIDKEGRWLCGTHVSKAVDPETGDFVPDPAVLSTTQEVLTDGMRRAAFGMQESVLSHPIASALLERAPLVEQSVIWTDPITGLACKARPDARGPKLHVNLKTTRDARQFSFGRDATKLGYDISVAHYDAGLLEATEYEHEHWFLAVENTPPYDLICYEVPGIVIEKGREIAARGMQLIKQAIDRNDWPGYPRVPHVLELRRWDQHDDDDEDDPWR